MIKIYIDGNIMYSMKIEEGKVVGQIMSIHHEPIKPKDVKFGYKQIRDIDDGSGIPIKGGIIYM